MKLLQEHSHNLQSFNKIIGVYFLLQGDEVVYVGQSRNLLARIGFHINERNKEFDRFSWIECDPNKLDEVELNLILQYSPIYNSRLPKSLKFTTMGELKSLTGKRQSQIKRALKKGGCSAQFILQHLYWDRESAFEAMKGEFSL